MSKSAWHKKWLENHPHASVQEYSDAVKRHTIVVTVCSALAGTVAFLAVVYGASLL